MHVAVRTLACLMAVTLLGVAATASAQGTQTRVIGRVTDESGAALPGVTITITGPRGTAITAVSDNTGQYRSPILAAGPYMVTLELSGFETSINTVTVRPGEALILDRQLNLASLAETVTVLAPAPVPPAPVPVDRPSKPSPIQPVPKEALASVCGPAQPVNEGTAYGRIAAHRDDLRRKLYGNDDVLVLDIGTDEGVKAGENLVVRRRFRIGDRGLALKHASFGEQTAGLIQVVETNATSSIAVVIYTCGELMAGDAVEPVDLLPLLNALGAGLPQFDDPARIVFGDNGQSLGAPQQLMVIDRGALQGARRGQRITIFRRPRGLNGRVTRVGDGIVVSVQAESATIRIEHARDAISVGDLVALYR